MLSVTEDKIPTPLIPDTELCDVRIGATDPALFFRIDLNAPYHVTIEFQEFNSAARCVLFLSPTDPHPNKHTAVWKCLSPEQSKKFTILPADPSYQVGVIYLAVRYIETSGNTYIRLKLKLRENYEAEWYSAANRALYYGTWLGFSYHGRGRCIYGVEPELAANETEQWSARSIRQQSDSSSWRSDFTPLLDRALLDISREEVGWSILPLPSSNLEVYDGEWVNGKKEGRGIYQWSDKSYWGMWYGGLREGFGVMSTSNGLRYEGEWKNDRRNGFGKSFYPDGTKYQGEWEDDLRSGKGLFIYTNGINIECTWKNDEICSIVTARYPDCSFYKGYWSNNCRHGEGSYTDSHGNVFEGTWEFDKKSGNGKITFINGVICVSTWENDIRKGGTFTFPNGEIYIGEWDDDMYLRQGQGHCIYPNGDEYEGSWCGDKKHGFGKLIQAGGKSVYEGEWYKDKRHGLGLLEDEEGLYQGEFRDNARCGQGLHLGRSGSMYRGSWKDDGRVGAGMAFDATTATTYDGLFLLGKLQSVGRSRSGSGVYEGGWSDGRRQGRGVLQLPTGDIIEQRWCQGAGLDGPVLCRYRDGGVYAGDWAAGQRTGLGTHHYADGSIYEGEWSHDQPHGRGRRVDARGEQLEGEWCDGELIDAPGRVQFADGSVYEGELVRGKPHGTGRLEYPDGTIFDGRFQNGRYVL